METTIDNKHMRKATNPVWRFFISVKLTVVLLILLAVTSAAGTIIPQTGNPEQYIQPRFCIGHPF